MPLSNYGYLSLNNIKAEFGNVASNLANYYRDGPYVKSTDYGVTAVPGAGALISINQFRGSGKRLAVYGECMGVSSCTAYTDYTTIQVHNNNESGSYAISWALLSGTAATIQYNVNSNTGIWTVRWYRSSSAIYSRTAVYRATISVGGVTRCCVDVIVDTFHDRF